MLLGSLYIRGMLFLQQVLEEAMKDAKLKGLPLNLVVGECQVQPCSM
jgi:hypothetical protein